jgi:ketosteroid isomerase-like protein
VPNATTSVEKPHGSQERREQQPDKRSPTKYAAARVTNSALTAKREACKICGASVEEEEMRNWILCSCIALALPCFASAQQPAAADKAVQTTPSKSATAQPKLADLLEAKVRAAWEAFKNRDKNGYAAFLTDDFQAVEADGDGEHAKLHVLFEVEHSMYTDYLLQFFQVQQLGPHYAFVTYESTMQFPKGSAARFKRVFIGELWTNRDGEWKMMRYQETAVR